LERIIDSFTGEFSFLSNFYFAEIRIGKYIFTTNEHAYHTFKSNDEKYRNYIISLPKPWQAKRESSSKPNDWFDYDKELMFIINWIKYISHRNLRIKLLNTNNAILIEGNKHGDTFWGMCNGKGENNLGKIIMKIRKLLQIIYI